MTSHDSCNSVLASAVSCNLSSLLGLMGLSPIDDRNKGQTTPPTPPRRRSERGANSPRSELLIPVTFLPKLRPNLHHCLLTSMSPFCKGPPASVNKQYQLLFKQTTFLIGNSFIMNELINEGFYLVLHFHIFTISQEIITVNNTKRCRQEAEAYVGLPYFKYI